MGSAILVLIIKSSKSVPFSAWSIDTRRGGFTKEPMNVRLHLEKHRSLCAHCVVLELALDACSLTSVFCGKFPPNRLGSAKPLVVSPMRGREERVSIGGAECCRVFSPNWED